MLSLRLLDLLTVSFLFLSRHGPRRSGPESEAGRVFPMHSALSSPRHSVTSLSWAQESAGSWMRNVPGGSISAPGFETCPNFVALLMPLLVQSFVLAEQLAMAMESRGFARGGRTLRRIYRISLGEYGMMGVALGLLVVYGVWGRGLWG